MPPDVEDYALGCIQSLNIPSHRAEISLLEAARARAAADNRQAATRADIATIAPLALRQRRSLHLESYAAQVAAEDATISQALRQLGQAGTAPRHTRRPKPKA